MKINLKRKFVAVAAAGVLVGVGSVVFNINSAGALSIVGAKGGYSEYCDSSKNLQVRVGTGDRQWDDGTRQSTLSIENYLSSPIKVKTSKGQYVIPARGAEFIVTEGVRTNPEIESIKINTGKGATLTSDPSIYDCTSPVVSEDYFMLNWAEKGSESDVKATTGINARTWKDGSKDYVVDLTKTTLGGGPVRASFASDKEIKITLPKQTKFSIHQGEVNETDLSKLMKVSQGSLQDPKKLIATNK